jgi:hypothetical protein
MIDEDNLLWYMMTMPFDCFNLFPAAAEGEITFDIPDYSDWYCIFANNRHLNNLQNVCGTAKLYYYEETGVDEPESEQTSFVYLQNSPNPFNPDKIGTTTISFNLATSLLPINRNTSRQAENARIKIYNIKGQKIRTFSNLQINKSPNQQVVWDGKDENGKQLGSGIYFYQLQVGNKTIDTKRCLLLR